MAKRTDDKDIEILSRIEGWIEINYKSNNGKVMCKLTVVLKFIEQVYIYIKRFLNLAKTEKTICFVKAMMFLLILASINILLNYQNGFC